MIDEAKKRAILRSWKLVAPLGTTVADLFYRRLFELKPEYRELFGADLEPQKRKLLAMLQFILRSVDWPDEAWQSSVDADDDLFLIVLALGRRHSEIDRVTDEAYEAVGEALLWTLDHGLGEAFDGEVREAWAQMYGLVSRTMKLGRFAVGEAAAKEAGSA